MATLPEIVVAAVALVGLFITAGVTVGLFYAHVAECNRFRVDIIERLARIESRLMAERLDAAE